MNFLEIYKKLEQFWFDFGCTILVPHFSEVGAGTLHPATVFSAINSNPCKIAYLQPSIRPNDGRCDEITNRLYRHHQYQVLIKPFPANIRQIYIKSLKHIGLLDKIRDLKFIGDDWSNPAINAEGLGWEVSCDGMEITQFTYMQKVGGVDCKLVPCEIAYGLERIAMTIQEKQSVLDIDYDGRITYGNVFAMYEKQYSSASDFINKFAALELFDNSKRMCESLLENNNMKIAAYEYCLKACHAFNIMESSGLLTYETRVEKLGIIRALAKACCKQD